DVIDANLLALKSNRPDVYHIGSGVGSSMFALARTVKKIFGRDKMAITRNPRKPEDSTRIWLDISKAGEYLGYQPKFDLQRGLEDYKTFMES
ncbi:MAG: GDP-mannose 4,6-dehydratase, partial [Nitrospinales bacterium]